MRTTMFCLVFLWMLSSPEMFSQNYIPYHQKIIQAEDSITMEDYEFALNMYWDAFSSVNRSFTKDLYNAAICAAILNDTTRMFSLMEQCLKQGVCFNKFETNTAAFSHYFLSEQWKNIKKDSEYYEKIYLGQINKRYKELLDSLNVMDQIVRSEKEYCILHRPQSKKAKAQRNKIRHVDSINFEIIKQCLVRYGYPSERNMGIGSSLGYFGHVCVWHITDSSFLNIQEIAFLNGEISVERYVAKLEYCHRECYDYFWRKKTNENCDEKRKQIGFPQSCFFEHLRNYYKKTHNIYGFVFPYYI